MNTPLVFESTDATIIRALKEESMDAYEIAAWEIALRKGWIGAVDYPERLARLAAKLRAEDKGQ